MLFTLSALIPTALNTLFIPRVVGGREDVTLSLVRGTEGVAATAHNVVKDTAQRKYVDGTRVRGLACHHLRCDPALSVNMGRHNLVYYSLSVLSVFQQK